MSQQTQSMEIPTSPSIAFRTFWIKILYMILIALGSPMIKTMPINEPSLPALPDDLVASISGQRSGAEANPDPRAQSGAPRMPPLTLEISEPVAGKLGWYATLSSVGRRFWRGGGEERVADHMIVAFFLTTGGHESLQKKFSIKLPKSFTSQRRID